jgi:hypothetical protein
MAARLLDGTAVAQQIRSEMTPAVQAFTARAGRPPGIALVLVGNNPASELYVGSKLKSAGDSGLRADLERLPADASMDDLLRLIDRLNRSGVHDGILVQSPLPDAMGPDAERRVFDAIAPEKDVDGFHPVNVGKLVQGRADLVACTPSGVVEILERSGIGIAGARAVVIGRSDIVGKPMALLLLPFTDSGSPRRRAASGHPGGSARPPRICHARVREARCNRRRRGDDEGRGSRRRRAALRAGDEASCRVREAGGAHARRRASGGRAGRRRADASARRRRAAHDRDALEEHRPRRGASVEKLRIGSGFSQTS